MVAHNYFTLPRDRDSPMYTVQGFEIAVHATDAHESCWPYGSDLDPDNNTVYWQEAASERQTQRFIKSCGHKLAKLLGLTEGKC